VIPAVLGRQPRSISAHTGRHTATATRHEIPVIGGGAAGIMMAARLRRKGEDGVAIIEVTFAFPAMGGSVFLPWPWHSIGTGSTSCPSTKWSPLTPTRSPVVDGTGAADRKQAPVVVSHIVADMAGGE